MVRKNMEMEAKGKGKKGKDGEGKDGKGKGKDGKGKGGKGGKSKDGGKKGVEQEGPLKPRVPPTPEKEKTGKGGGRESYNPAERKSYDRNSGYGQ